MPYMEADPIVRPTLVIAPDFARYDLWRRRVGMSRREAIFVSGWEQLYGHGRVNIIELGYPLWWTDEDTETLEEIRVRSED